MSFSERKTPSRIQKNKSRNIYRRIHRFAFRRRMMEKGGEIRGWERARAVGKGAVRGREPALKRGRRDSGRGRREEKDVREWLGKGKADLGVVPAVWGKVDLGVVPAVWGKVDLGMVPVSEAGKADLGVVLAASAAGKADLGVVPAAWGKVDLGMVPAALAAGKVDLGVAPAASAAGKVDLGVVLAASAVEKVDLGVAPAASAVGKVDLGVIPVAGRADEIFWGKWQEAQGAFGLRMCIDRT